MQSAASSFEVGSRNPLSSLSTTQPSRPDQSIQFLTRARRGIRHQGCRCWRGRVYRCSAGLDDEFARNQRRISNAAAIASKQAPETKNTAFLSRLRRCNTSGGSFRSSYTLPWMTTLTVVAFTIGAMGFTPRAGPVRKADGGSAAGTTVNGWGQADKNRGGSISASEMPEDDGGSAAGDGSPPGGSPAGRSQREVFSGSSGRVPGVHFQQAIGCGGWQRLRGQSRPDLSWPAGFLRSGRLGYHVPSCVRRHVSIERGPHAIVFRVGLPADFHGGGYDGTCQADEPGFVAIFDGRTLAGWEGEQGYWTVADGAITGQSTKEHPLTANTFLVWRGESGNDQVRDFELRLKIRIEGGNSGIQYRSREVARHVMAGYQADYDAENKYTGILYDEQGRGILATRGQKVELPSDQPPRVVGETTPEAIILAALRPTDWNDYRILAVGNHIQHFLNGHMTVDVTDRDPRHQALSGRLALQMHAGPPMKVQFKNVRLRRIGPHEEPSE